jgi:hypothetical protein
VAFNSQCPRRRWSPIPDSKERLDRALAAPAFDYLARLRRLQAESARFDVGQVWRTTGSPSVVLRFLLPGNQAHFTFKLAGQERMGSDTVLKLAFAERERPTAIDSMVRTCCPLERFACVRPTDRGPNEPEAQHANTDGRFNHSRLSA